MSNLVMNQAEEREIDSKVEQMMDWAKNNQTAAEQLAMDAARLMACSTDRLEKLRKQKFFARCWNRLNGASGGMERANVNDVIQMQKMGFRYINILQEQQLLMAHSLLSLKNNLNALAVKEEETRDLITHLAKRTLARFEALENRVDQLAISTNLQGWLLGLEEREYTEKYPTQYMRLLRIINDFYSLKSDNWNYNDLMFMRKAIRTVEMDPKQKISLKNFIINLIDEIQLENVGFDSYEQAINMFKPDNIQNFSLFALENVSSPVFVTMHGVNNAYRDRMDIVEDLQDEMDISASEALKILLRKGISRMNVNLDYEFPLAETAIEILGCLRLAETLAKQADQTENEISQMAKSQPEKIVENEPISSKAEQKEDTYEEQKTSDQIDTPVKEAKKEEMQEVVRPPHREFETDSVQEKLTNDEKAPENAEFYNSFYIVNSEKTAPLTVEELDILNLAPNPQDILVLYKDLDYEGKVRGIIALTPDSFISIKEYENNKLKTKVYPYREISQIKWDGDYISFIFDDERKVFGFGKGAYWVYKLLSANAFKLGLKIDESEAKDDLINIFTSCFGYGDDSLYVMGKNWKDKIMKKVNKGLKVFGQGTSISDLVIFFDDTMFGGADNGFLITHEKIKYCNFLEKPQELNLKDMRSAEIKDNKITISDGYRLHEISCSDSCVRSSAERALSIICFNNKLFFK